MSQGRFELGIEPGKECVDFSYDRLLRISDQEHSLWVHYDGNVQNDEAAKRSSPKQISAASRAVLTWTIVRPETLAEAFSFRISPTGTTPKKESDDSP